jgi:hypothetical protein
MDCVDNFLPPDEFENVLDDNSFCDEVRINDLSKENEHIKSDNSVGNNILNIIDDNLDGLIGQKNSNIHSDNGDVDNIDTI